MFRKKNNNITECLPLRNNKELLNYYENPFDWTNLVEPIAQRSRSRYLTRNFDVIDTDDLNLEENLNSGKVIVCHDLKGNYRNDRFVYDTRKWDDYRFYEWSGIDIFCYFSHEYITIPPISWINAAHQNGVKIIGTFITEHINGQKALTEALSSTIYMHCIAESLVLLAKLCKFDGWFFNVECSLREEQIVMLNEFVLYLTNRIKEEINGGIVIWYDSITVNGQLSWQNELNLKNKLFFDSCDGIFLNYSWSDINLQRTNVFLDKNLIEKRRFDVYFGIDIFGRGQVGQFLSHETLSKIRENRFSAAIFAPGWTFESLQRDINIDLPYGTDICNSKFLRNNEYFWGSLWKYFNSHGPKCLPFYTSFCIGSGKLKYRCGARISNDPWFNLNDQKYQPSVPGCNKSYLRNFEDSFDGGSCLEIISKSQIRLFVSDFEIERNGLILSYAFKRVNEDVDLDLVLIVLDKNTKRCCKIICSSSNNIDNCEEDVIYLPCLKESVLRDVHQNLLIAKEKCLPRTTPINGWEIRFYKLQLEDNINGHVIDIGVQKRITFDIVDDRILFGAISIHNSVLVNYQQNEIPKISINDFM